MEVIMRSVVWSVTALVVLVPTDVVYATIVPYTFTGRVTSYSEIDVSNKLPNQSKGAFVTGSFGLETTANSDSLCSGPFRLTELRLQVEDSSVTLLNPGGLGLNPISTSLSAGEFQMVNLSTVDVLSHSYFQSSLWGMLTSTGGGSLPAFTGGSFSEYNAGAQALRLVSFSLDQIAQVNTQVLPVPEPSAVLWGMALLGSVAGLRVRRRSQPA